MGSCTWSFVVLCLWQALKEALAHIRVCSRLEGLLLKKKILNNGDTPEVHAQKVCFQYTLHSSFSKVALCFFAFVFGYVIGTTNKFHGTSFN